MKSRLENFIVHNGHGQVGLFWRTDLLQIIANTLLLMRTLRQQTWKVNWKSDQLMVYSELATVRMLCPNCMRPMSRPPLGWTPRCVIQHWQWSFDQRQSGRLQSRNNVFIGRWCDKQHTGSKIATIWMMFILVIMLGLVGNGDGLPIMSWLQKLTNTWVFITVLTSRHELEKLSLFCTVRSQTDWFVIISG